MIAYVFTYMLLHAALGEVSLGDKDAATKVPDLQALQQMLPPDVRQRIEEQARAQAQKDVARMLEERAGGIQTANTPGTAGSSKRKIRAILYDDGSVESCCACREEPALPAKPKDTFPGAQMADLRFKPTQSLGSQRTQKTRPSAYTAAQRSFLEDNMDSVSIDAAGSPSGAAETGNPEGSQTYMNRAGGQDASWSQGRHVDRANHFGVKTQPAPVAAALAGTGGGNKRAGSGLEHLLGGAGALEAIEREVAKALESAFESTNPRNGQSDRGNRPPVAEQEPSGDATEKALLALLGGEAGAGGGLGEMLGQILTEEDIKQVLQEAAAGDGEQPSGEGGSKSAANSNGHRRRSVSDGQAESAAAVSEMDPHGDSDGD